MELDDPSRLRVFRQLAPRGRRQAGKIRVDGEALAVFAVRRGNLDGAARQNPQTQDDFLIGTGVAALFQLLTQHVQGEHHPAAVTGLVEVTAILLGGDLAQGRLPQRGCLLYTSPSPRD